MTMRAFVHEFDVACLFLRGSKSWPLSLTAEIRLVVWLAIVELGMKNEKSFVYNLAKIYFVYAKKKTVASST